MTSGKKKEELILNVPSWFVTCHLSLFAIFAFAQSQTTGRIAGIVEDQNGAVIVGAEVTESKRRKIEGDELDCTIRLEPWMINHELITVREYGPDIDGVYHTRMVRHRLGPEWETDIEAWRPLS